MTKEDKDLLLKDLCARLPYEVILLSPNGKLTYQTDGNTAAELLVEEGWKPYLRPMSSMTEEEDKEWQIYKNNIAESCDERLEERISELHDWFNSHHFDFHHLIEKGLAIEVTENNNPYRE